MFEIKVDGIDTIDTDIADFRRKVDKGINYGLKAFASELTPCLQRHIQSDVYEAYTPEDYERRYDHPQYGRSIYNENNMEYHFLQGGKGVEFTYEPNGRNTRYPTSAYYLDGDSIISVIQKDNGYLWLNDGSIGTQRPFWNRFVQEVGAMGDNWFVQGFNKYDHEIQAQTDGNITDKTSDYKLNPTGEVKTF